MELRPALRPVLYEVEDREAGGEFCLKLWRKTGTSADAELRELWRHEMRHVQRVMSHGSALGFVVNILEFVEDDSDFGVLMERAGRPLNHLMSRASQKHWLRQLSISAHRVRLWRNVRRLVVALGAVHAQGLVHGAINEEACFTEGALEPDFRLGAFEWSLWLDGDRRGGAAAAPGTPFASPLDEPLSFARDWQSLGKTICRLIGITIGSSGTLASIAGGDAPPLTIQEIRWLRGVIFPGPRDALDVGSLAWGCDEIVAEVSQSLGRSSGRCTLLVPRTTAGLGDAVYDVTCGAVTKDDFKTQLTFVQADLDSGTTVYESPANADDNPHAYLVTARMVYTVRPYYSENGTPETELAVCRHLQARGTALPFRSTLTGNAFDAPIDAAGTEREAKAMRNDPSRSTLDWEIFGNWSAAEPTSSLDLVRFALHLVEVAGAVIKSLDILPIEILSERPDQNQLVLRAHPANECDPLARDAGLGDTASMLQHLFEDEERDSGIRWRISPFPGLGSSRARDAGVSYVGAEEVNGISGYCFEYEGLIPDAQSLYLRPEQDMGTDKQIRRRQRNIETLNSRADVLRMLEDPWRERRTLRATFSDAVVLEDLDQTKRVAIGAIWTTAPAFWVVGPPGVGKTKLATAAVHAIFRNDPAARILICAQGHDALDNLEEKIAKLKGNELSSDLVIVRSNAADRESALRLERVSGDLLRDFLSSNLVQRAPPGLRGRIAKLEESSASGARKADLSSLALESANIVISTLNSGDIERMAASRDPFDWVIVEEAAKATGPELAGALALGNRVLLIGDHRQLPPFDASRLNKVFKDGELVRKITSVAPSVAGHLFNDTPLDDLFRMLDSEEFGPKLIRMARSFIEPFRAFAEEDEKRARLAHHRRISSVLTEQRRMDPAIARLVSSTFYGGALTTSPERIAGAQDRFAVPVTCLEGLPDSPVVVVDFPHVSRTGQRESAERARPKWHNPAEIDAVIDVLRHVRAAPGRKPSLAVLSPYAAQVRLLDERLRAEMRVALSHLGNFAPVREGMGFTGTVDSFQGSEADIVIVSLVRNNPRVGLGALGFLRERRRLNVMLSRAKHKLFLVGSLSFLEEAARGVNPDGSEHELLFLQQMAAEIRSLAQEERFAGVRLASIIPPGTLRASR